LSFFLVLLNVLVDLVGEGEFVVNIAGIRVIRVRTYLEILLLLPLKDAIAPRRVVALLLDLLHEGACLVLIGVAVFGKKLHQLLVVHEVACDHGERQPAEVADVLAPVQGFQQIVYHRALS
jgi:hypothetical protein